MCMICDALIIKFYDDKITKQVIRVQKLIFNGY